MGTDRGPRTTLNDRKLNEEMVQLSMENPAFKAYVVCASVLVLKMLVTGGLMTFYNRMRSQIFVAEEDTAWNTIFFYMRKGGPITKLLAPAQHMKSGDKKVYQDYIERLNNC